MSTLVSWFEIPAVDFERGVLFYEAVFGVALRREDMGPMRLAIFPHEPDAASGAVCHMPGGNPPGAMGTVIYLDGGDDLALPLARVAGAGGTVVVDKTLITPEIGYFAVFRDTEGNHVGLFSPH